MCDWVRWRVVGVDLAPYRAQIESALVYTNGTHTFADIVDGVDMGAMQAWPGERSIVISQIVEHPQCKVLVFFLAGGVMAEIRSIYDVVMDWGKMMGCTRASVVGRDGWARTWVTKEEAWRPTLTVYEKEID